MSFRNMFAKLGIRAKKEYVDSLLSHTLLAEQAKFARQVKLQKMREKVENRHKIKAKFRLKAKHYLLPTTGKPKTEITNWDAVLLQDHPLLKASDSEESWNYSKPENKKEHETKIQERVINATVKYLEDACRQSVEQKQTPLKSPYCFEKEGDLREWLKIIMADDDIESPINMPILMLVNMQRYLDAKKDCLHPDNIHCLMITGYLLSKHFSSERSFPLDEHELQFLSDIDYKLFIPGTNIIEYQRMLEKLSDIDATLRESQLVPVSNAVDVTSFAVAKMI